MLSRVGTKWISTTEEGTFETTPTNAHYSIPVHLIDILESTNAEDASADIDSANKAIKLYNMACEVYKEPEFLSGMTKKCIVPLFDAISKDYQAPRTCGIIAHYAIREAWYTITELHDTEMLWEMFKFFRDKVFPLTLREYKSECEQYARIVHAFYRVTGCERLTTTRGIPIHDQLRRAEKEGVSFTDILNEDYRAKLKWMENGNYGSSNSGYGKTNEIYMDLIEIPKILSDLAMKLNNNGFKIGDKEKEEYKLVQKYYGLFYSMEMAASDDYAYSLYKARKGKTAYEECHTHGWYGFCYSIATIAGLDSKRKAIAKELGNYSIVNYGIEAHRKIKFILYLIWRTICFGVAGAGIAFFIALVLGVGYEFGWFWGVIAGCAALGAVAPSGAAITRSEIKASGDYHVSVSDSGHVYYWK